MLISVVALCSARPQQTQSQVVQPRPIVEKNVESDSLQAGEDAKDLSGAESVGYGYYAGSYPYSYGGFGYGGYGYPYYSGYSSYIGHGIYIIFLSIIAS